MKLQTVEDLFLQGLQYTLDAEKQLTEALPKMAEASSTPELKKAFENHLSETKKQVSRLEEIFRKLGKEPETKPNAVVKQMRQEADGMIAETDRSPVRDSALIVAGNQIEHFEMASYGCLVNYAELLAKYDLASMLRTTLQEEKEADAKLTEVAERYVNVQAMHRSAAAVGVH